MPYLVEILLFVSPLLLFLAWRWLNPALEGANPRLVPLALVGLLLALGAAAWFGLTGKEEPGAVYVPAELGRDGTVRPGHTDAAR